jgi:hypothetical protein
MVHNTRVKLDNTTHHSVKNWKMLYWHLAESQVWPEMNRSTCCRYVLKISGAKLVTKWSANVPYSFLRVAGI